MALGLAKEMFSGGFKGADRGYRDALDGFRGNRRNNTAQQYHRTLPDTLSTRGYLKAGQDLRV